MINSYIKQRDLIQKQLDTGNFVDMVHLIELLEDLDHVNHLIKGVVA